VKNSFYQALPTGGNYWDNWISPDVNGDEFVDIAYSFHGTYDRYPFTLKDGWNKYPVAIAGSDQKAKATGLLTEIELDGSESYDPDDDPLTYIWTYKLNGENNVTGVTPVIELPLGEHFITLIVNDGKLNSEPDEVVITVLEMNSQPVANSGENQTIEATGLLSKVELDGSGSYDPDGDPLIFTWMYELEGEIKNNYR
jgi:hypothetical protein